MAGFSPSGGQNLIPVDYIPDPTGGATVDAQARAAIKSILTMIGKNRFMNQNPSPPSFSGASPANSATDVALDGTLAWDAQANADSYNVYFGTTSPPPYVGNVDYSSPAYDPGGLTAGTSYYWMIGYVNDGVEILSTVQTFATEALPDQVGTPNPADTATAVTITGNLSWAAATEADSYDVYLGTNATNVLNATNVSAEFKGNQAGTTYTHPTLTQNTTYYWRIDSVDPSGTTKGTVWSFTTLQVPAQVGTPSPTDAHTNDRLDATIGWAAAARATSYDVYFGTDQTAVTNGTGGTSKGNQAGLTYDPGTLVANTTYYWRIDSKNSSGTTTGLVWSYTTSAVVAESATGVGATANWFFTVGVGGSFAALTVDDVGGGSSLQIFHGGIWNSPTAIATTDDGTITATYSFSPTDGDPWRIQTEPAQVTFASSRHCAVPLSGTVVT